MNTSGWIFTIVLTGAAVGTGVAIYKNQKRKKQQALDQETERKRIEEEQQRAASSASNLWNGLNSTQTLALQKKLNAFYATGTLGWPDWEWVDTAKNKLLEWSGKAVDYADSLVKTAKSEAYGPQGLDAFKAAVASVMPLQEDGLYGPKTTAAVKALQEYLNANGARLNVDGLYGDATDSATGWGIKALAGFKHFQHLALIK